MASETKGALIASKLALLFADATAPGVRDVLAYAGSLDDADQQLVARAAVDLFSQLAKKVHE